MKDPAVVGIHGLGGTCNIYGPQIAALGGAHRFVTFDLNGHGMSPMVGPISIENWADDVVALMDDLELAEVALVSHSMGTLVAQQVHGHRRRAHPGHPLFLGPVRNLPDAARSAQADRAALVRAQGMAAVAGGISQGAVSAKTRAERPVVSAMIKELLQRQSAEGYAAACEALGGSSPPDASRRHVPGTDHHRHRGHGLPAGRAGACHRRRVRRRQRCDHRRHRPLDHAGGPRRGERPAGGLPDRRPDFRRRRAHRRSTGPTTYTTDIDKRQGRGSMGNTLFTNVNILDGNAEGPVAGEVSVSPTGGSAMSPPTARALAPRRPAGDRRQGHDAHVGPVRCPHPLHLEQRRQPRRPGGHARGGPHHRGRGVGPHPDRLRLHDVCRRRLRQGAHRHRCPRRHRRRHGPGAPLPGVRPGAGHARRGAGLRHHA